MCVFESFPDTCMIFHHTLRYSVITYLLQRFGDICAVQNDWINDNLAVSHPLSPWAFFRHQYSWCNQTAWKEGRDPQVLTDGQVWLTFDFQFVCSDQGWARSIIIHVGNAKTKPRMWSCFESNLKPRLQKQVSHFFTDVLGLVQLRKADLQNTEKPKTLRWPEMRSVCVGEKRTVFIWRAKLGYSVSRTSTQNTR